MFTIEDYKGLYEELVNYKVSLDVDPIKIGLNSLVNKLAEVQGKKDRVSTMLLDAIHNLSECQTASDTGHFIYDRNLEEILRNRSDIRELKSEKLRTSAANIELSDQLNNILTYDQHLTTAKNYHKSVKVIHDNLESANSNISRQLTVIEDMIEIGEVATISDNNISINDGNVEGKKMRLK